MDSRPYHLTCNKSIERGLYQKTVCIDLYDDRMCQIGKNNENVVCIKVQIPTQLSNAAAGYQWSSNIYVYNHLQIYSGFDIHAPFCGFYTGHLRHF